MRFEPFAPLAPERARLGRVPAMGVSGPSPQAFSPGVFKRSPSPSSSCPDKPNRRLAGVPSSTFRLENAEVVGGEGVDKGADDGAVVPDDVDGTRRPGLAGVDIPEFSEPSERSGIVPMDWFKDASGRELSAADIAVCSTPRVYFGIKRTT